MAPYQDTGAYVFNSVDQDLMMLSDCAMKVETISANQYSKYYEGRVQSAGKEIKYILEFYNNWK